MQKVIELARSQVNQAFMLQKPTPQPQQQQQPNPMSAAMIANQYSKKNQETNDPVLSTPNPLANFFAQKQQQQQQLQLQNQNNYAPVYATSQPRPSYQDPRMAQVRSRSPVDEMNGRKVKKSRFSSATDKVDVTPPISMIQQNLQNLSRSNAAAQNQNQNHIQQQQQILLQQQQQLLLSQQQQQNQNQFKPQSNAIWDQPPPFQNYNTAAAPIGLNLPMNNVAAVGMGALAPSLPARSYQTENSSSDNDIGFCVKVSGVTKDTNYEDLKKFFVQTPINDIKFLSDNRGQRNGIALIRFATSDAKKKALTRNMWQLNKNQVLIMSITEEDFETGLMSSTMKSRSNRSDDYRSRERSDSREREQRDYRSNNRYGGDRGGDRDNFNHGGNNYNNFQQRDNNSRNNRSNFRNNDNQQRNDRNERADRFERSEKKPDFPPDEIFTVLKIDDIPPGAIESDILAAFPNILTISIDRFTAYAKFISHDAAKEILADRPSHFVNNKRVFFYPASKAQFDDVSRRNGKFANPDFVDMQSDDQQSNDSSQTRSYDSRDPRDPRQRSNFNNDNRNNDRNNGNGFNGGRNNGSQKPTDCIIIKGMDPETTIDDVESFFRLMGIRKLKVHILLNTQGQPCGDCFVEFGFPQDVGRACSKTNSYINKSQVSILSIPREQVDAILNSFTPGSGSDNVPNYGSHRNRGDRAGGDDTRQNRWAPPSDFGTPGCVVMISNLSYRASIDNMLEKFSEYGLRADQITRRFNDNG